MNKGKIIVLETSIDDINPEFYEYTIEKLIKVGAKEVFIQPIVMKRNRMGALLTVICEEKLKDKLIEGIFNETTAFGIRIIEAAHIMLEKEVKRVKTRYGSINVKIGKFRGKIKNISPEYKNCEKLAKKKNIPIKTVYNEAIKKI